MTDEMFKRIYERTRIMLWCIFGCVVIGALLENKIAVILGTFMILTISVVLVIVKYSKNSMIK